MTDNYAALMAKFPQEGKVKTRLADSIGTTAALRVYESLLFNVTERCLPLEDDNYHLSCFVDPEDRVNDFTAAFSGYSHYAGQSAGDLGERMHRALTHLFEHSNAKKGLLIGADIPDLDRTIIIEAFRTLDNTDIVLGPSRDGGYYLIAMNKLQPELFTGIAWSSCHVVEQSLSRARESGLRVELLSELHDLDTIDDLRLFPEIAKRANLPADTLLAQKKGPAKAGPVQ